jgi:hypothetical protein
MLVNALEATVRSVSLVLELSYVPSEFRIVQISAALRVR